MTNKSVYIPIKLTAIQETESAKASKEDLDKPDLTKAELDELFNSKNANKGNYNHEQSNS